MSGLKYQHIVYVKYILAPCWKKIILRLQGRMGEKPSE